ncbi:MAG TPA: TetR/AcrR family transcriptional regulator [Chryseolinea sp.]|nr:TetR/AcrR family transcriptional regulator [Chryseolinea sp.]
MGKATVTRQFIIDKTAPLFNTKGYNGTSLNDLTEATGLTKGSLYGNFDNKEEIAVAVFYYSMERVREAARLKMEKAKSSKEKLLALLDFYSQYVFSSPIPGGCPLMNNAVEADDQHVFMKKAVAAEIKRTIDGIAGLLAMGKKEGEFKSSINEKEIANLFFCSIEGAIIVSRVSSSDAAMKNAVSFNRNLLKQISK